MIEFCCSVNTWLLSLKYGRLDASFTASMRRISEIQIPAFRLLKLQTCISRYHLAHILLICNSSHFPHLVQHKVKKQPDSIHLPRTQYSSVQNNTKILGDARSGEHEEGDGHHRHALHHCPRQGNAAKLPDARERSNKSTTPTATTEAPGRTPAPVKRPGPQPPPALVSHHQYNTYHTVKTMHCPTARPMPKSAQRANASTQPGKLFGQHKR